jgi:hypothetical protein
MKLHSQLLKRSSAIGMVLVLSVAEILSLWSHDWGQLLNKEILITRNMLSSLLLEVQNELHGI